MCDEYRMNGDKFRIDANERIVKNTEIDQQWADWLAPTRRSFLFGAGAAAVGLTLGEEGLRAEEPTASLPGGSGPAAAFLALNGPIKPYVSAGAGASEWGYETLKQPHTAEGTVAGNREWHSGKTPSLYGHQELPCPLLLRLRYL